MMCVAFTVWENRISPVFDVAHDLLIVRIEDGNVGEKRYYSFDPDKISSLIAMLDCQRVESLICGAISEVPARMIVDSGIHLIPFISGNVDQVLQLFAKGQSIVPGFLMPGCGCPKRTSCEAHRGRSHGRGPGRGPGGKGKDSTCPEK